MRRALITGITGQDGSYLAEFLLSKDYEVHGLIRRASTFNTGRIDHIYTDPHQPGARLFLHYGDLSDSGQLGNLVYNIRPEEIYHLGAQSHVRVSFDMPEYTGDATGMGTTRLLEAIRRSGISTRYYQASSSELFGASPPPQSEKTPFHPRSPYAASKLYAYWMAVNYREGYGLFACNGILFNHESPRRGEDVRHAQDYPRRGEHPQGYPEETLHGQLACLARLGLCPGVRRDDAPDAPAGAARRLRCRDRREPHG